jgi:hypothetical protein
MRDDSGQAISEISYAPADAEFLPLKLKRLLLGSPIPTFREKHQRLPKVLGLAVFSSDALSSVAYATEEIFSILIEAGWAAWYFSWPISLAIVALLFIVATAYYQTIPLLHYIEQVQDESPDQIVTVILPEFVPAKWWQHVLHNQTAL